MTTHAIVMHETGGPEVLRWEPIELPAPAAGEARVRHAAIGLNFIDTYHRTGLYPTPLPAVLGSEGAGVVEAVGAGVENLRVGDRVAYATGPLGAYAEARNVPGAHLVKVPSSIDDRTAAAVMLKGLTAHYLVEMLPRGTGADRPLALVQAAAGGVGLLLTQWLKSRGATVIGTVGSEEKAALARENGCDHVVLYRHEDVASRVRALGGAHVAYDSVGKDTFHASLDCLRPRGLLVTFGQSSGPVGPFDPRLLAQKGSLSLTRPKLGDFTVGGELPVRAKALFEAIGSGVLRVRIAQTYPLRDAATAHRDLEDRKTVGSTLLLP
jgi:NADPH2:quinone reductase